EKYARRIVVFGIDAFAFAVYLAQAERQWRMVLTDMQTDMPCRGLQAIGFQIRCVLDDKRLDFDVMQTLEHPPDLLNIGFGVHRGCETPSIFRLALYDHGCISATSEVYFLYLGWREGQYGFITQGMQ